MNFATSGERLAAMFAWSPPVERETFPAPLRTSREPLGSPVPGPVGKIASAAMSAGWDVLVTQAEGYWPHATTGRPGVRPKVSWAVRLRRDDQRAVAVRVESSWMSLWYWTQVSPFQRAKTLAEFMEWIR